MLPSPKSLPNGIAKIHAMKIVRIMASLAALAALLGACLEPLGALAQNATGVIGPSALAPSAVVANAGNYDGQTITVTGTVTALQTDVQKLHADFEQYQLCDGKASDKSCVTVIDLGRPALQEGQQTTASGMYRAAFHRGDVDVSNILIVKGTSKAH